jgi:HlyD family secretion protein
MKNNLLPIAAAGVLVISVFAIINMQPKREKTEPYNPPPRSSYSERVAAVGLIESNTENITLSAPLPGVVEEIYIKVGQDVKKGERLVKLDTRALEAALAERQSEALSRNAQVESTKARAARAQAALEEAQWNLKSAESLSDSRSISTEELKRRRAAAGITDAELQAANADIQAAQAAAEVAQAAVKTVKTDLERSVITAPIDGRVLQVRLRPGEYASGGPGSPAWMILGNVTPLHVRVDVDEHEAWRVEPNAPAVGQVRGNSELSTPMEFVRFEPYVIPKQSLTGASNERVDTRVMQAIYRIKRDDLRLFVGQQMDVFIESSANATGNQALSAK